MTAAPPNNSPSIVRERKPKDPPAPATDPAAAEATGQPGPDEPSGAPAEQTPPRGPADAYDIVKWGAFATMVADHVAVVLIEPATPLHDALRTAGRAAIPLFTWILASRLAAAPDGHASAARALKRLALFGALALPLTGVLGQPFPWMNALLELGALTAGFAAIVSLEHGKWRFVAYAALSLGAPLLGGYGIAWWGGGLFAFIALRYGTERTRPLAAAIVGLSMAVPLAWGGYADWPGTLAAAIGPSLALEINRRATRLRTRTKTRWAWPLAYPAHLALLWAVTVIPGA